MDSEQGVRLDRLRSSELMMLVASVALVLDLLAFPWYSLRNQLTVGLVGLGGHATDYSAGSVLHVITPFAIVCVLLTWAIGLAQVTHRGPAVPLGMTMVAAILDTLLTVALFVRVVFDQPVITDRSLRGANEIKPDVASLFGLLFAILLLFGAWRALRTDGIAAADSPRQIETLRLTPRRR